MSGGQLIYQPYAEQYTTTSNSSTGWVQFETLSWGQKNPSNITFSSTIGAAVTSPGLSININRSTTRATVTFGGALGTSSNPLGYIAISGNAIQQSTVNSSSSYSIAGTSTINGSVTTGTWQSYTGNSTISNNVTLTATTYSIEFLGTVNSDSSASPKALTAVLSQSGNQLRFYEAAGTTNRLGAVQVTGDLISRVSLWTTGAVSVSGTS
jgi:hypothetical protein